MYRFAAPLGSRDSSKSEERPRSRGLREGPGAMPTTMAVGFVLLFGSFIAVVVYGIKARKPWENPRVR